VSGQASPQRGAGRSEAAEPGADPAAAGPAAVGDGRSWAAAGNAPESGVRRQMRARARVSSRRCWWRGVHPLAKGCCWRHFVLTIAGWAPGMREPQIVCNHGMRELQIQCSLQSSGRKLGVWVPFITINCHNTLLS
jgi:hypothetical protein